MSNTKRRGRQRKKQYSKQYSASGPVAPPSVAPPSAGLSFDPRHGMPVVGVTNGDEIQFGHLDQDGQVFFAAAQPTSKDIIIGPGSISPQDAPKLLGQTAPAMSISYDIVQDNEFEETLRGHDGMVVFHQMMTDGTVANGMNYLFGAMLAKQWKVLPGTYDAQGFEIAQFVKEQLGLDDTGSGKYAFSRLFTVYKHALQYGQAYGEIVLSMGADNKVVLDKILPIHPWAVSKIEYDKQGGPKTLVLSGTVKGTGEQVSDKKVPIYKTVTFTHDDDGTFSGKSFLRAAVAHWRVKRSLIVLINQSMERFLLGVPIVNVPKAVRRGTAQWDMAQQIARDYILKPRTGIILSPGWTFEVAKLNVSMPDALPYLEYHDAAIARAMGIDFNTVRQAQNGDAPNVGAFMDMTELTVETMLREFASAVNLFLIPKLVLLNWPEIRVYPRISFEQHSKEDFSASANLMGMIINAALKAASTAQTGTGTSETNTDGTNTELNIENVPRVMQALMGALPPRFQRALGIEELQLLQAMSEYQTGASTAYKVDRRKARTVLPSGKTLPTQRIGT